MVIYITLDLQWKFAKARIFDINQRTNKLSGISNRFISMVQDLTQIVAWISGEEIKMAKMRN
jgi:hypothetical protein